MSTALVAALCMGHMLFATDHDSLARHPKQGLADLLLEYLEVYYAPLHPTEHVLYVSVQRQRLYHVRHGRLIEEYIIATAKAGLGQQRDSYRTPTGLHRVAEKHGEGVPFAGVLKDRVHTGEIADLADPDPTCDMITTRLLWLEGMEPGINQGDGVDSYERMIYIHGTGDETSLGAPTSRGCVRMANRDVLTLFDQVPMGTWVVILDN